MAISSRKDERQAILAEFTKYFTPEAEDDQKLFEGIADRMFKVCYELIQAREMWLLLYQPAPGLPLAMTGWFASENEARKGAESIVGGSAQAVKVIPFARLREVCENDETEFRRIFGEVPCAGCGHSGWAHGSWRLDRGKLVKATPPAKNRCAIGCPCREYQESLS